MSTKYTKEVLQDAADNSDSIAGVLRYLGLRQAGGTQSYIGRRLKELDIDTSHFLGQAHRKGKPDTKRLTAQEILVVASEGSRRTKRPQLLRAMLESGVKYQCRCGLTDNWQGMPISLEIDHINGDWLDNRLENLRFLCPNCHSQEATTNRSWKNK